MKGKNIIIIVFIILIIGIVGVKIQEGKSVNKAEESIVEYVKSGNYYSAVEEAKSIVFEGGKRSKKVTKLVDDVKLYLVSEKELESTQEINLERMKQVLDEMTGSYKKYDEFKKDIEELKERTVEIEEFRKEVKNALEQAKILEEEGKLDEAFELVNKYFSHVNINEVTDELCQKVSEYYYKLEQKIDNIEDEFDLDKIGGARNEDIGTKED